MKIYLIEKEINDEGLSRLTNCNIFSELNFNKNTLRKRFIDLIDENDITLSYISQNESLENFNQEGVFWTTNITFISKELQKLFIKKLYLVDYDLLYGDENGFIFKGHSKKLLELITNNFSYKSELIFIRNEKNLIKINNSYDYKKLILELPEMRYFNRLEDNSTWLKKISTNKEKIKSEFIQLQSVPHQLKKYYVESRNFLEDSQESSYETKKIDGVDLSVILLNNNLTNKTLKIILNQLSEYFQTSFKLYKKIDSNPLSFVLEKNIIRLEELSKWEKFDRLQIFVKTFTEQNNVEQVFAEVANLIQSLPLAHYDNRLVYSHGDLCFSNIILEESTGELTFVDPRGTDDTENFLTPYYDVAKLSHSLLGGYDLIINNQAIISFDNEMIANLEISIKLNKYEKIFEEFVTEMKLNYRLIKLIEISLFLSMLPLHKENFRKVTMLFLRALELLKEYKAKFS